MPNSTPQVTKGTGPDQLPQGAATELNKAYSSADVPGRFGETKPTPSQPKVEVANDPSVDQTGGMDNFLFGPTARPNEPVTSGLSFGPGPGFVSPQSETPEQFDRRVATELMNSPLASSQTKALAARMLNAS